MNANEPRVFLVGAGPGDPDLLTVQALRVLQGAEIVVYDRLVSESVLALVPVDAERIFAGKASRKHYMPQETINDVLVTQARSGRRVVRLKGGDPFIFGRGSEEALHLAQHGIPFEIVPGITASMGCAAYAGIPLTHRGLAKGVHFVTGHMANNGELDLDWNRLADPETTLVIYMGLMKIDRICNNLIQAGLPEDTPAAAIQNGTLPTQKVISATLARLPGEIAKAELSAPTLFVVGSVAAFAETLAWHEPAEIETRKADQA
ncbi:MAG: uroporphyrinogen-III C-methyltransferase [Rhodospirillaceae bacterium]|nr:uroporphyrinogen-III C-methyltransferase [Rhodospirillaceae bacterium]MDD9915419.1 uroporphyrinogen-III C-methyltransferase [Rhodospirillaceae bacterium]